MGCSTHSVPSLSNVAMRSAGGTKSGPPSRVMRATKSIIARLAGPSCHDGNGSSAADATCRHASPRQTTSIVGKSIRRSCTISLRIIQLPENQLASLRFTDVGGGTREGARPAVPTFCYVKSWGSRRACSGSGDGAMPRPATPPRGRRGVHRRISQFQGSPLSHPAPLVRTRPRSKPRLSLRPRRRWSPVGDVHERWTPGSIAAPVHAVTITAG